MVSKLIIPRLRQEKDGTYTIRDTVYRCTRTRIIGQTASTEFGTLYPDGNVKLFLDYNWNGPSGGAINTVNTLMPSAKHDFLCDLIEQGKLDMKFKRAVDKEYRRDLKRWKVPGWRRGLHFRGLRVFGGFWTRVEEQEDE